MTVDGLAIVCKHNCFIKLAYVEVSLTAKGIFSPYQTTEKE